MRAKRKPVIATQPVAEDDRALTASALAASPQPEPAAPVSSVAVLFVALFALGFAMVGASAVPPRRIPWAAVAEPLFVHRSNLMALGIGAIALAFLCLNVAVLF